MSLLVFQVVVDRITVAYHRLAAGLIVAVCFQQRPASGFQLDYQAAAGLIVAVCFQQRPASAFQLNHQAAAGLIVAVCFQ